jgi:lipopolysaccharide/colanic/teichoic acid biosynthesis glycosyltransferase
MYTDELGRVSEMTAVAEARVDTFSAAILDGESAFTMQQHGGPVGWRLAVKRSIDVLGAGLGLLLVVPIIAVVAVGVRLSSPGPILYRQTRVGRYGRHFTMLKFRTFPVDHVPPSVVVDDGDAALVPVTLSPLRFGRLLRQTSFDELPQLLNVLRGEMSLVGPRPERPELVSALADRIPQYRDRHRAPVGLTGHAQVLGLCGTTPIEDRVAADNAYIDGWTLRRDAAILARTVPTLVRKVRSGL